MSIWESQRSQVSTVSEMRCLVAELAERGLKVDYRTMWAFAHGEGLSFKKNRARQ